MVLILPTSHLQTKEIKTYKKQYLGGLVLSIARFHIFEKFSLCSCDHNKFTNYFSISALQK